MLPLPSPNDIHVWSTCLDLPPSDIDKLARTLSEDEMARADRFHFQQHRLHFIAARGMLRIIMGKYLHIEPQQVIFAYSPKGKPSLGKQFRENRIEFNLSHSQEIGLYGFSWNRRIGVDIEYKRSMRDILQLARRFFAKSEYELLSDLPLRDREDVFFRIWTAKEAYLKAIGEGLGAGLEQVEVFLDADRVVAFLKIDEDPLTKHRWSVIPITTQPDYIATIVVEGQECNLHRLTLENIQLI